MTTRLFSDLVNRLAASVPGCPQPVILTHICSAAIEACERTGAWRYQQADVDLTAGTSSYAFVPPDAETEVHTILTATVNGNRLVPATLEQVVSRYPKYPSTVVAERTTPQYLVHINPDTFDVAPVPDDSTTYTVKMFLALKPIRTATGMEDTVMDDLETVIMHGALQHLLVLPETTWSDRELAAYHAKQYAFKSEERRARTNLGAGRAVPTVASVPWA